MDAIINIFLFSCGVLKLPSCSYDLHWVVQGARGNRFKGSSFLKLPVCTMPPRAFPYPFQIGIDICHIDRIEALLRGKSTDLTRSTRPLERFLFKVLTWPERQAFKERFGTYEAAYNNLSKTSSYLAGRYVP